jgi:uncharacterized repeat protein (TIGR01451 family)
LVLSLAMALGGAATAHASVTLGDTTGATDGCGTNQVFAQEATAGPPSYVAPSGGVVTSWSYLAGAGTPAITFKVYTPTSNSSVWFLRSESTQHTGGTGAGQVHANQLNTFAESPGLPIHQGDHLGLTGSGSTGLGCITTMSGGDMLAVKAPPDTIQGQDNPGFNGHPMQLKLDLQAVVEPDADGDSFGDESQDSCPTDATVHTGPCPVDVSIVKTVSASPVAGSDMTYTLAVKNNAAASPATGVNVVDPLPAGVTFVSSTTSQGGCSGTATVTCALGSLAAGATATVAVVVRPTAPGALMNTASVSTTASDTDASNDSSTVATTVAPFIPPVPVLSRLKLKPATFKTSKGTAVSYVDSQAATTTLTVYQLLPGVRKGKKCVAPPRKKKKGTRRCTRLVRRGSFTRQDLGGPVSFRFKGKLGRKTLAAGSYRLSVVAVNAGGKSKAAQADFKIKK